ncbi:MAG TPA: sel1 repeat family protein [Rhodanobacteraceae bacterium]|nr:sel1 repeat family protein [Rhodanobacteraceae bacterium]
MNGRRLLESLLSAACIALLAGPGAARAQDAPDYSSADTAEKPAQWTFATPEQDGRPGLYYFYRGVEAVDRNQYAFAVDMYRISASWAYKPAEYNLAVMYAKGEGVPVDKPLAMAWAALAAERGDPGYIEAREAIYAELTPQEFRKANEIWRDLKKTYGDETALRRAKARWAMVKASITGSHVGSVGNLRIGGVGSMLPGGWMIGSVAYRQLLESKDPYDPRFVPHYGTATVGPIVPLPDQPAAPPAKTGTANDH